MYLYRGFGEDAAEKCKEYNDNIGFAAYQKKPEFGHGIISAKGVMSMDVSTMYQIEQGSILVLNGNKIEGTQRDVAKEIYKE